MFPEKRLRANKDLFVQSSKFMFLEDAVFVVRNDIPTTLLTLYIKYLFPTTQVTLFLFH